MKRVSRKSLKVRKGRKTKKTRRARRARRQQRGGQVPTGYAGMPVSYTPREPGELGSVDAVPRVGTVEEATADAEAAQ